MWARRCGAPPLWPSRIKVLLQSFMTAAVGITVFNFMTAADPGYLELEHPKYTEPLCLTRWPLRHQSESWWSQEMWLDWQAYRQDMIDFVESHSCTPVPAVVGTCAEVSVPLHDVAGKLGIPLGSADSYQQSNDSLEIYALLFLFLTVCMWLAVVIHDFTLLSLRRQNEVLDLSGVNRQFPWVKKMCCLFSGWNCWRGALQNSRGAHFALAAAAAPFVFLWSMLVFCLFVIPVMTLLFFRHPIKMGRIEIFILCIAFIVMSCALAIGSILHLADVSERPAYAITWEAGQCTCGCVFPFTRGGIWRVLLMAVIIAYKSIMLGLRCLKGLRRSNWANLMTVMFAIPMTVYPAEWTRPDGTPIDRREPGQSVQGEPAFDPFAMMDEQHDSAHMTVELKPTRTVDSPSKSKHRRSRLSAPKVPMVAVQEAEIYNEEVGCCGFPYLSKVDDAPNEDHSESQPSATSASAGVPPEPEPGSAEGPSSSSVSV
mmetsp:Transcript_41319/g.95682  ORF Transcript_41319/g.95682 Transcript_41319/m.95682 type:complete len:485 (+) Transcript_41319:46-1500(+)